MAIFQRQSEVKLDASACIYSYSHNIYSLSVAESAGWLKNPSIIISTAPTVMPASATLKAGKCTPDQ